MPTPSRSPDVQEEEKEEEEEFRPTSSPDSASSDSKTNTKGKKKGKGARAKKTKTKATSGGGRGRAQNKTSGQHYSAGRTQLRGRAQSRVASNASTRGTSEEPDVDFTIDETAHASAEHHQQSSLLGEVELSPEPTQEADATTGLELGDLADRESEMDEMESSIDDSSRVGASVTQLQGHVAARATATSASTTSRSGSPNRTSRRQVGPARAPGQLGLFTDPNDGLNFFADGLHMYPGYVAYHVQSRGGSIRATAQLSAFPAELLGALQHLQSDVDQWQADAPVGLNPHVAVSRKRVVAAFNSFFSDSAIVELPDTKMVDQVNIASTRCRAERIWFRLQLSDSAF